MPDRHTRFVPHPIPFISAVVVSEQAAVPVLHDRLPTWHGLAGVHIVPAAQALQTPALHTIACPQLAPSEALPDTTQIETPVAHDVTPALQGSVGWQALPAAQAPQTPPLQTRSTPQAVPSI